MCLGNGQVAAESSAETLCSSEWLIHWSLYSRAHEPAIPCSLTEFESILRLYFSGVPKSIPILQEVDAQQVLRRSQGLRDQWIGIPATLLDRYGVVGFDQLDQCLPGRHLQNRVAVLQVVRVVQSFLGALVRAATEPAM